VTSTRDRAVDSDLRDRSFLDRAVALGRRGWGRVHPNPMVGCVIVREGAVVGEGWHQEYGGPHAEVMALQAAGDQASGAEAFVSLEPCRHEGQTPPCTQALLDAGVSRVVFGAADPGKESGGGGRELSSRGIDVRGPVFTDGEARWENPFFFHENDRRPWISLKLALSLDGRIAARPGARTRLTGDSAAMEVQRFRAGFDAILVGTTTALVDDPRLSVRGSVVPRVPPRRILVDARGRIPGSARVFSEPGGEVWLLTTSASPPEWRRAMESTGARVVQVRTDAKGRVAILPALEQLRALGMRSILCEGGGVLGASLLAEGVVDRLDLIYSPMVLGDDAVPAFPGWKPADDGDIEGVDGGRVGWGPGEPARWLGRDLWVALRPAGREVG